MSNIAYMSAIAADLLQATYIHTAVVGAESEVVVTPLSYLDMREGTSSLPVQCPSNTIL